MDEIIWFTNFFGQPGDLPFGVRLSWNRGLPNQVPENQFLQGL